jgi:tetratricopeptide (TPR) repeat protein
MPKAFQPRATGKKKPVPSKGPRLPKNLEDEVRRATRPQDQADVLARLGRAAELLERGDTGAAAREAEKAKARAPRSSAVREVLGLALYGEERWQEALTELKTYKRLTGSPDQNHVIADCLRGLGRPADAVPLCEEELRAKVPEAARTEAAVVGASALADQGRYAEALAFLRRVKTREDVAADHTLRLWYVKGDILERAGRSDEAAAEFRRIMRMDPAAYDAAERVAALDGA